MTLVATYRQVNGGLRRQRRIKALRQQLDRYRDLLGFVHARGPRLSYAEIKREWDALASMRKRLEAIERRT